jgi:hypothetical protein
LQWPAMPLCRSALILWSFIIKHQHVWILHQIYHPIHKDNLLLNLSLQRMAWHILVCEVQPTEGTHQCKDWDLCTSLCERLCLNFNQVNSVVFQYEWLDINRRELSVPAMFVCIQVVAYTMNSIIM